MAARVIVEVVTDPTVQPPEKVLKIVVVDPATGSTTTYVVHDFEDAQIVIETPSGRNVLDASGRVRVVPLPSRPRIGEPRPLPRPR